MQILSRLFDGQKTYFAAAGLMLSAVGGVCLTVANYDSPLALDLDQALSMFFAGLGLLGVGRKIEKASGPSAR